MSGIISISIDGTVTDGTVTDDNETFQESLIEELFGADQFPEVDPGMEPLMAGYNKQRQQEMSATISTNHQGSKSSSGSRSQSNSKSKNSSSSKRLYLEGASGRSSANANTHTRNAHAANVGKMQPIAEDVDKLVREDVRKMIAKIRSSTQQKPRHSLAITDSKGSAGTGTEKKLVRPGKYGEVDMRAAKARKDLARHSTKKDKDTKNKRKQSPTKIRQPPQKSPTKSRHPTGKVDDSKGSGSGSGTGTTNTATATTTQAGNKEKEARDQAEETNDKQTSSQEQRESNDETKEGHHKSKAESSPEQKQIMMSFDAEAKKSLITSQAHAGQNNNTANEESSNPAAAEKSNAAPSVDAGNVVQSVVSDLTKEENAKETDENEKAREEAPWDEAKDNQEEESSNPYEGEGIEREYSGPSFSDTSEEHILSMPKIEKIRGADDLYPIECVLATWEEIEEEEKMLQRQLEPRPDPSCGASNDEHDVAEDDATLARASLAERNPRTQQRDIKRDPSEIKPDPSLQTDKKQVVSADQESTAPSGQAAVPATSPTVGAASLSRNEPSREKESEPKLDTKINPTEMTGNSDTREKEATHETDVQRQKETSSQEDVLQETSTPESTTGGVDTSDGDATVKTDGTVELVLVTDSEKVKRLEYQNAKLKDTLLFLQRTAVDKEKYFAELAWFGKRSEEEVKKWRPNFWREKHAEFGPEVFEEFRADAMRIADPDVGDWEHGFSSGALAMARLLLGLSHAVDDEKICAFHDPGQKCTAHCVTCTVTEQRERELADFPVLDP